MQESAGLRVSSSNYGSEREKYYPGKENQQAEKRYGKRQQFVRHYQVVDYLEISEQLERVHGEIDAGHD